MGQVPTDAPEPGAPEPGADRSSRGRTSRRGRRTGVAILIVTVASGVIFSVSALTARSHEVSVDPDLATLVGDRQDSVATLEASTADLRVQVDAALAEAQASAAPSSEPTTVAELADHAVSGPGVEITLTDAPEGALTDDVSPDDLVVHQQDIEDVMNALWSGGAEAMTVQGERITARTVIRCIGNVILVNGTSYSPPYVIAAIGDVGQLEEAVESNSRIQIYQKYVAAYGLGWDMETSDHLEFDAVDQDLPIRWAQVTEDHG